MAETPPSPPFPLQRREGRSPGCGAYLLFAAAGALIIGVIPVVHNVSWFIDQLQLIQGDPFPLFVWPLISWAHGFVLAAPVALLAVFTRAPRFRAAYQTWLAALGYLFLLAPARFAPPNWEQAAALAQVGLSLVATAALIITARWRGRTLRRPNSAVLHALGLAPVIAFPFLIFGALGSPLDTLLNLLAGLSFGLFAGVLFDLLLYQPLTEHSNGPGWDIAFGGAAAGAALLILGSGFGFNGDQLLLMLALPMLGFAVIGLSHWAEAGRAWLPIALLVGLAAAAPLMFIDPDELTILLGDLSPWAFLAAGGMLLSALIVGLAIWALRNRRELARRPGFSLPALAVTWIGGVLAYSLIGQPGFYGERLFVILRDQADLSQAVSIPGREGRVRFVYKTLTEHADAAQSGLRGALDRLGLRYQPYYLVNAIEVEGGPLVRLYLATRPEVERVLDSPRLRPLPAPAAASRGSDFTPNGPQWNITLIGADRVWNELGVTGAGIVIGQSDSGAQGDHPALRESYRGRTGGDDYNWIDPWNGTKSPTDIGGHGTHTLGSALGRGGIGVAPGAEWIGCVNLARNLGNPAVYLDCMQFMLAPYPQTGDPFTDGDPTKAAHILNNSWGCPPIEGCDAGVLQPAVSALRAAGLFVVASAGNDGPDCGSVHDPIALYADVLSVGAIDEFGNVAGFSSRGPVNVDGSGRVKPEIVAPGDGILSAYPGSTYSYASGTSMAGPHVAGVVALMWSANPALIGDIDRTTQILIETARPYTGSTAGDCFSTEIPNNVYGYGMVDAYAAVTKALEGK